MEMNRMNRQEDMNFIRRQERDFYNNMMGRGRGRGRGRERERDRERGRGIQINIMGNNPRENFGIEDNIIYHGNNEIKDDHIYFEDLINFPKKIYPKYDEEDINILSLSKFKEMNINKLKEDIFYYCSSPETLLKLSQNIDDEKNYEFYQDLISENFLYSQKEKNKLLTNENIKLKPLNKSQKLSNYSDSLCLKMSEPPPNINIQEKNIQMKNANLIINKIEEINMTYKEKDEKIIEKLKELDTIIQNNKIEMKFLGFILFNCIENNLCNVLNLVIDKLEQKEKNETILTDFGNIFKSINENFKSVKILTLFIKFCSSHLNIIESIKIDEDKPNQFISENSLNFDKIYDNKNLRNKIFIDFRQLIKDKDLLDGLNNNKFNYTTLNYDDNIFIFFNLSNNKINKKFDEDEDEDIKSEENNFEEEEEEEENYKKPKTKNIENIAKDNILYYLKINLNENRVIDYGKIELVNNEKIIDMNISIKNEFIYCFYIIENVEKETKSYSLKCKIYNQSTLGLIKENIIQFKELYIPIKLFNDSKYLYCISSSNEMFIIQKKYKLNHQKYVKYSVKINENGEIKAIDNLNTFQMYNYLSINNLFIIEDIKANKKYISKCIFDEKDEYLVYLTEITNSNNNQNIKLSFNNNRFAIIKLLSDGIIYNITNKDNNNLIENGIMMLPFDSNNYENNSKAKNIYEYLLQQYSSFLNIYGNFDLLCELYEQNLINYPFSYCCNFTDYNLDFVIKKIMEKNDKEDIKIKLYYLIILKQMICSLYNSGIVSITTPSKSIYNLFIAIPLLVL